MAQAGSDDNGQHAVAAGGVVFVSCHGDGRICVRVGPSG
jgi:hypothetical protein